MNKKKILIIDDEPSVCASLELVLEEDYNITIANTAQEGINKLKDNPGIDLILLDVRMPGMDGLTSLTEIRKVRPDVKIAIVTAGRSDEVQEKIKEHSVNDYIVKPFGVQELLERVGNLLK
ncbi:MAG: response regulator transcription factor [Candidatus Margulisiibacteriota bacterium]